MKLWMVSLCYLPMIVSAIRTPREEFRWAAPMYVAAFAGIALAIVVLALMTWEPAYDVVHSVARESAPAEGTRSHHSAAASRQSADECTPLMQMQWQGMSP